MIRQPFDTSTGSLREPQCIAASEAQGATRQSDKNMRQRYITHTIFYIYM
ncbi:MAG: hypothetical protein II815_02010 [Bacteroidales bacterium]|nr:hypothetical protein [Bacteroidales bacterium]